MGRGITTGYGKLTPVSFQYFSRKKKKKFVQNGDEFEIINEIEEIPLTKDMKKIRAAWKKKLRAIELNELPSNSS